MPAANKQSMHVSEKHTKDWLQPKVTTLPAPRSICQMFSPLGENFIRFQYFGQVFLCCFVENHFLKIPLRIMHARSIYEVWNLMR